MRSGEALISSTVPVRTAASITPPCPRGTARGVRAAGPSMAEDVEVRVLERADNAGQSWRLRLPGAGCGLRQPQCPVAASTVLVTVE